MSEAGMIDANAVELFGRMGALTTAANVSFVDVPSDAEWGTALGHQGIIRIGPRDAASAVRDALRAALEPR
jgi:hypothetical protein